MTSIINIMLEYNVLKLIIWKTLYYTWGGGGKEYHTEDPLLAESFRTIRCQIMLKGQKKSPALRNLNFSEESPQMDRPKIVSDFVFYFKLVLHQVLEAGSANISIRVPVYPWFIINKHNVTDSNISSPDLHHFLVLADFYKSWLQSTLPSIRFWPSLDTELFLKVDKCNQNIAKAIPFFFRLLSNTFSDFGAVGRKRKKKAEKKKEKKSGTRRPSTSA